MLITWIVATDVCGTMSRNLRVPMPAAIDTLLRSRGRRWSCSSCHTIVDVRSRNVAAASPGEDLALVKDCRS